MTIEFASSWILMSSNQAQRMFNTVTQVDANDFITDYSGYFSHHHFFFISLFVQGKNFIVSGSAGSNSNNNLCTVFSATLVFLIGAVSFDNSIGNDLCNLGHRKCCSRFNRQFQEFSSWRTNEFIPTNLVLCI